MKTTTDLRLDRRRMLQTLSVAPLPASLLAAGGSLALFPATPLRAATPACGADADATQRQTEGPYFTRDSPQRSSLLEADVPEPTLVLVGRVLSLECVPLAGVLLDFWQADAEGMYDNRGYRLRGHQFTDADGRYRLETVVPGIYPGRTRHLHVKVQWPKGPVLTTQLYFPGEARNRNDRIFSAGLLVHVADPGSVPWVAGGPRLDAPRQVHASFDFAIRTG